MNCYYHPKKAALGICKHCQRGLCTECIAEVDDSLACNDRHEEQVGAMELLNTRNILQAERAGSAYVTNAIFYLLVGVLFSGYGVYLIRFLGLQGIFLLGIGVFLIYAAIANYMESRKY